MKTLKAIGVLAVICLSFLSSSAQMTQNIRGKVVDQDSKLPLDGVLVQLIEPAASIGAITDEDGLFRLENVPVGRVTIKVTYIGYEDRTYSNLLLNSAKELVLNVQISESVASLKAAVVKGKKPKQRVINEMAIISSRSFSVEETKRYAGAIDDPARMVSAYAGVNIDAEGNNDIIVRGNSSKGILWRLEGMEIPNPNHFANNGATGGPINALNSNMLGNSDFLTGAFTAEYGNATSGVFDMRLRNGNNEHREYTATASVLGLDMALEGPFKKDYQGSYLVNYRYSTLDLLDRTGVVDFGGVPRYQDLSFKLNLPLKGEQKLSVYGLGGLSSIGQEVTSDDPEETDKVISAGGMNAGLGVLGLSHSIRLTDNAYLKSTIQGSSTLTKSDYSIPDSNEQLYEVANDRFIENSVKLASTLNLKVNAQHKIKTGFILDYRNFDLNSQYWSFISNQLENTVSQNGNAQHAQAFVTWKYRASEKLTFVNGVHYLHFFLNNSQSLEPRLAAIWKASNRHSLNLGMGIHSKIEPLSVYLGQQQLDDGSFVQHNKGLGLMKAAHFVAGYRFEAGKYTYLKTELFYQHLYDVPVDYTPGGTFSLLNQTGGFTDLPLRNEGTGRNYGVEFTAERSFQNGFYGLGTVSLYKSLYTPVDGVERESRFSGGHVVNILTGKEFAIGNPAKNRTMFTNVKLAWIGGSRYTPIDLVASIDLGDEVRTWSDPFSAKGDDILKLDLAIGMRRNHKKYFTEWKIDVQNATNNQGVVNQYYVHANQAIEQGTQLGLLPVISYKWQF